jgi:hypothetical protein
LKDKTATRNTTPDFIRHWRMKSTPSALPTGNLFLRSPKATVEGNKDNGASQSAMRASEALAPTKTRLAFAKPPRQMADFVGILPPLQSGEFFKVFIRQWRMKDDSPLERIITRRKTND